MLSARCENEPLAEILAATAAVNVRYYMMLINNQMIKCPSRKINSPLRQQAELGS